MSARIGHFGLLAGLGLDQDAADLIVAIDPQPSPVIIEAINDAFVALKAIPGNVYARLDRFSIFKKMPNQAAGLLDWKNPAISLSISGSATWSASYGVKGNQTTGHISTGYNPSSSAVSLSLNSFSVGAVIESIPTTGAFEFAFGCQSSASANICLFGSTSSAIETRSAAGFGPYSAASAMRTGHFVLSRTASNATSLMKNGSSIATAGTATVSVALPNAEMYLCANNNNGTTNGHTDMALSAWWCGGAMSASEQDAIKTVIDNFLAAMP